MNGIQLVSSTQPKQYRLRSNWLHVDIPCRIKILPPQTFDPIDFRLHYMQFFPCQLLPEIVTHRMVWLDLYPRSLDVIESRKETCSSQESRLLDESRSSVYHLQCIAEIWKRILLFNFSKVSLKIAFSFHLSILTTIRSLIMVPPHW